MRDLSKRHVLILPCKGLRLEGRPGHSADEDLTALESLMDPHLWKHKPRVNRRITQPLNADEMQHLADAAKAQAQR